MRGTEMPEYVNNQFVSEPRREQEKDTHQTERRLCKLLFLSFGLLCILQATLNVSLRLFLYSREERDSCNITTCKEPKELPVDCKKLETQLKMLTAQHNNLLDRFNALKRDNSLLQNKITDLDNMRKNVEEERDRLRIELKQREHSRGESLQRCPAAWREINSKCYYLSTQSKTWAASRADCQSKGADLVIINSKQEQTDLYQLDQDQGLLFWIGLSNSSGSFKWVDGSTLTTSFWQSGQPSDAGPHQQEDCVEMYHRSPVLANWNNAPCGSRRRGLCETDPQTSFIVFNRRTDA